MTTKKATRTKGFTGSKEEFVTERDLRYARKVMSLRKAGKKVSVADVRRARSVLFEYEAELELDKEFDMIEGFCAQLKRAGR